MAVSCTSNTINVYNTSGGRPVKVCTFGPHVDCAEGRPHWFNFNGPSLSGGVCFYAPTATDVGPDAENAAAPLLLVADLRNDTVVVLHVDNVSRHYVGVCAWPAPVCVAASGSRIAVSSWGRSFSALDHVVRVFEGSSDGKTWALLRVLGRGPKPGAVLYRPGGLRFTAGGRVVFVADTSNCRVVAFRVADGAFLRHFTMHDGHPLDIEECAEGWCVAWWMARDDGPTVGLYGPEGMIGLALGLENPQAVAASPHGLLVRTMCGGVAA